MKVEHDRHSLHAQNHWDAVSCPPLHRFRTCADVKKPPFLAFFHAALIKAFMYQLSNLKTLAPEMLPPEYDDKLR